MIGDWVRAEIPYSMPCSIESEEPTNGSVAARAPVSRLRVTSTWSRPSGRQLAKARLLLPAQPSRVGQHAVEQRLDPPRQVLE